MTISWQLLLPPTTAPTPAQLVVPGQSVGQLRLGVAGTAAHLPTSASSYGDGAMSTRWATWYGQGSQPTQLDVYSVDEEAYGDARDKRNVPQVVRTTSPYFRLASGLRVGSTRRQLAQGYQSLVLTATYRLPAGPRYLYDDVARGIAFELDGTAPTSRCRALVVHLPGLRVASTSIPLAAYLARMPVRQPGR